MKILKVLSIIVFVSFLISCNSSRRVINSNDKRVYKGSKKVDATEKEIYAKSDTYFRKFKNNNSNLNSHTIEYIGKYKNIAIKKMMEYNIPASITLAQGILESGNGRSDLARKANNHFGIKCHKGWKGKKIYHDDDRRHECFRKYNSPEGSFDDHSLFLTKRGRYTFLFDFKKDNYKAWAKGLKKAGYATDRKYPSKLINFIEAYKLYHYDKLVLKSKGQQYRVSKDMDLNHIMVRKGDTLYSIARNNNLTVEELKRLNNLYSNEISIGQKLYLKK
ncbi:MAG: glucosaminidase domain-containing protein [Flavobacteriaceae bacterium]|nr:glucosaminidase domain-containing protein [Flavobacteriaceae bacterium]